MRSLRMICSLVLVCAALTVGVLAQAVGEISGTLRQATGAVLSGARVRVVNQQTRSEHLVYSDTQGFYRVIDLAPGSYSVEAGSTGFEDVVRRDLVVAAGSRLRLDLELTAVRVSWMPSGQTLLSTLVLGLIPTFIVLFVTNPGTFVTKKLWAGCEWVGNSVYRMLAPRFPRRIGLPGYYKRVRRSPVLGRIEHPVGPAASAAFHVALEQAFAPLAVLTDGGRDRVDLFSYAAANPNFLVLGGPGTGKTTLMKSLVISILAGRSHETLNGLTPVFVVLREMAAANYTVDEAVTAALSAFGFSSSGKFIQSLMDAGRLVIILDGLDEVGASRPAVVEKIQRFCRADALRETRNRVVVTCRESSYRVRDLADDIPATTRVEPFAPQHIRTFLQGWPPYKGRVALRLYNQIVADPQILDICKNPLLLTILTGLYLESDRFEVPLNRNAFYRTAIEELLEQRPGRRGIVQTFGAVKKWQVLQRISLEQLVTLDQGDAESFSRERLAHHTREVLGAATTDKEFEQFLAELIEVNSIIKVAGDAGFLLGHRTFQEYLAALEARRTRTVDEAVTAFGARPELAETICFYCGLLDNIPSINSMLEKLARSGHLVLAGRCLMYASEAPRRTLIESLTQSLFDAIVGPRDSAVELDVLASVAQRQSPDFDCARSRFSDAIDHLTSGDDLFAVVTALAASPQRAMAIAPALLEHAVPQRRLAGLQLLHDVGTDEALDMLVLRVGQGQAPDRAAAAGLVASLIRSRNLDLRRRAVLLPERSADLMIWPFEPQFPGRLAIPMILALAPVPVYSARTVRNGAIAAAVERQRDSGSAKRDWRWERVNTYLTLQRYSRRGVWWVQRVVMPLAVAVSLATLGVYVRASMTNQVTIIEPWQLRAADFPRAPLIELRGAAENLRTSMESQYPAPSLGVRRLLPWNWTSEPAVKAAATSVYGELERLVNYRELVEPTATLATGVSSLLPSKEAEAFLVALKPAEGTLTRMQSAGATTVVGSAPGVRLVSAGIALNLLYPLIGFAWVWRRRRARSTMEGRDRLPNVEFRSAFDVAVIKVLPFQFMVVALGLSAAMAVQSRRSTAIFGAFIVLSVVLVWLETFDIPPNPYTKLRHDLEPLSTADE